MAKRDPAIRHAYEEHGVDGYYTQFGSEYRNPHEEQLSAIVSELVSRWKLRPEERILDLACGSGEITLILRGMGFKHVNGVDPYTSEAYEKRTGTAIYGKWTFEEIAGGCLAEEAFYDAIICSFAAHLIGPSYLPSVMIQLQQIAKRLIIVTPHKRPHVQERWGWRLEDEFVQERVRARLYLRLHDDE